MYGFYTRLEAHFVDMGLPFPVAGVQRQGEWICIQVKPECMNAPCQEALTNHQEDTAVLPDGNIHWRAITQQEVPTRFYHGTSPEIAMRILAQGGIKALGDLSPGGGHRPDGVYCYPSQMTSLNSTYVRQGAQVQFEGFGLPLSVNESKEWRRVPKGFIGRQRRSVAKAEGAMGVEWIFHPDGILIKAVRVRADKWDLMFKDHLGFGTGWPISSSLQGWLLK